MLWGGILKGRVDQGGDRNPVGGGRTGYHGHTLEAARARGPADFGSCGPALAAPRGVPAAEVSRIVLLYDWSLR
jgi:hypothetical protein